MGHGFDTIVSTPDNLPLQMVGCVSCGKCAETCPTGSIETNPRVLESYDLDESRCMFCGECVEVCPYDALEQKEYFELADYDRARLAGQHLFVRDERPADPLRANSMDLVPHMLDSLSGQGVVWEPMGDKPIDLDADEEQG
jgi:Fe-S-cluster-containing hydrogenase component 2